MYTSTSLASLRASAPLVNPSLLACDFAHLEEEIRRVEEGGAKIIHLDIMDGVFVPNISFGIPVVEAVRRCTRLPMDVHLMITRPQDYIKKFREAGADLLTIHVETIEEEGEMRETLNAIREMGAGVGLSLNPSVPVETLEPYLDLCDLVLVMSVDAGFGGQEFNEVALKKLRWLRDKSDRLLLSVDGGVHRKTLGACAEAGADIFVTGTALFREKEYGVFIEEMTQLARSVKSKTERVVTA